MVNRNIPLIALLVVSCWGGVTGVSAQISVTVPSQNPTSDSESAMISSAKVLLGIARQSHDLVARVNALAQLGELAPMLSGQYRKEVVEVMVQSCRDSTPEVRREGFKAFSKFANDQEIPHEVICRGLSYRNSDVASFAAECVIRTKQLEPCVVAGLIKIIEEGSQAFLLETIPAIDALANMRDPSVAAYRSLSKALTAADGMVAAEAAFVLAEWKWQDERLFNKIMSLLNTKNFLVRLRALDAVAALPESMRSAELISVVRGRLEDHSPAVRERAEQVLARAPKA